MLTRVDINDDIRSIFLPITFKSTRPHALMRTPLAARVLLCAAHRTAPAPASKSAAPTPLRSLSTSRWASSASPASDQAAGKQGNSSALRSYFYHVDVHGQLFLTETEPKNITSCFKSVPFLDFFFDRLQPNPAVHRSGSSAASPPAKPSIAARCQLEDDALREGYPWLSPCGPEMNFVRAEATPVVFRELDSEGQLHWAGSRTTPFEPASMVVDVATGYLYHPSPRTGSDIAKSTSSQPSPYGQYSLLSSALVLTHFSTSLEYLDPSAPQTAPNDDQAHVGRDQGAAEQPVAGTIEWAGRRWALGVKPSTTER